MTVNMKRAQPKVRVLGYFDEEEMAHIPESQRSVVDHLIENGDIVDAECLQYDKGKLQCVQILDPRKTRMGYVPITLYVSDFRMEVFIECS